MSQGEPEPDDDFRPSYDASMSGPGVRGKYLRRYRSGTDLARLEPEIRAAVPTDAAVNGAMRSLLADRGT